MIDLFINSIYLLSNNSIIYNDILIYLLINLLKFSRDVVSQKELSTKRSVDCFNDFLKENKYFI